MLPTRKNVEVGVNFQTGFLLQPFKEQLKFSEKMALVILSMNEDKHKGCFEKSVYSFPLPASFEKNT